MKGVLIKLLAALGVVLLLLAGGRAGLDALVETTSPPDMRALSTRPARRVDEGERSPPSPAPAPALVDCAALVHPTALVHPADPIGDVAGCASYTDMRTSTSTLMLDRDGRLLRAYTVADGRWRLPVDLDSVDPAYVAMLLAYEDRRFASHPGVDALALMRAGWQLLTRGRIGSGGSTLTMQLARLLETRSTRDAGGKLQPDPHRALAGATAR